MPRPVVFFASLALISGLFGCDHATKAAAVARLAGGEVVDVLPGILDLRYAENHDTAFSLLRSVTFQGKDVALASMAVLALAGLCLVWMRARGANLRVHAALALIVAGALGNIVDRLSRGFVVDFIHVHYWPVFNVADIAIVVGGALLAFSKPWLRWGPQGTPTQR